MHSFVDISDYAEQKRLIEPIQKSFGKILPAEGTTIVFAELDENGEVVSYQMLQNALFAEGLYARDATANLRTVWNRMRKWIKARSGGNQDLYVMAATDKVAQACKTMGCEELPWRVFRRKI